MSLKGLELCATLPPLDELQRFNAAAQSDEGGAGGDLGSMLTGMQAEGGGGGGGAVLAVPKFEMGDRVLVTEGERRGSRRRALAACSSCFLLCVGKC